MNVAIAYIVEDKIFCLSNPEVSQAYDILQHKRLQILANHLFLIVFVQQIICNLTLKDIDCYRFALCSFH